MARERRGGIRLDRAPSNGLAIAPQCQVRKVSAHGDRQYRARQRRGTGPPRPGRRIGAVALLVHVQAIINAMKSFRRVAFRLAKSAGANC